MASSVCLFQAPAPAADLASSTVASRGSRSAHRQLASILGMNGEDMSIYICVCVCVYIHI